MIRRLILLLAASAALCFDAEAQPARNLFRGARVAALDARRNYEAEKAVDGQHFRSSTWMPANDSRPPYLLEVSLDRYCDIDSMVIYTGIPEGERTQSESMQSAGYWNMKNFIIQYWDDANWTDIGETLTTENRLDKIVFRFRPAVTSFRFRIRSTDGEPIRIIEFEGYGRPNASMPSPSTVAEEVVRKEYPSEVGAAVHPEAVGRSMRYVGYNQGYFMPGSNVSAWLEYSGVNAVRLWMPLDFLVPETAVDAASRPESLEAFDALKESLRRNPQESAIDWDTIARRADSVYVSTNTMVYNYALDELRRLGIESLIQTSAYKATPDWPTRWLLWQRMYALAYYSALRGGVEMFAMQNEPNHRNAGPIPLDEWIRMMRIASDAVHCGVEDAAKAGAGDLQGKFVGPVTAGTNTNWWAAVAAAEGTDYRGEACERELVDLFSTHSYNLPATGYEGKTPTIDRILCENHPQGRTKPILYTEIGRWMNAYLIDKEETMDSPTLFTEWAGIYARNMVEGCSGMWAFKFANTASSTYPQGIKSGHHHIWKGRRFAEDAFRNYAPDCRITASSTDAGSHPEMAVDGIKDVAHGWHTTSDDGKWLVLELPEPTLLGGIAVYTGTEGGEFTAPDRIRTLRIEAECDGAWQTVADLHAIRYAQLFPRFETPLKASRIRISSADKGHSIIREVKLFGPEFIDGGEASFDIGGAQRTAEVVRLFAKGFGGDKPLLRLDRTSDDPNFDLCAAADSVAGALYLWMVHRYDKPYRLDLDLSALGITDAPVVCERVDERRYGDAGLLHTDAAGRLSLEASPWSVTLLTVPFDAHTRQTLRATASATLCGDGSADEALTVALNSAKPAENAVALVGFKAPKNRMARASRILLRLHGASNGTHPFRFHIYGSGQRFGKHPTAEQLDLDPARPGVRNAGSSWFVAGETALTQEQGERMLDVTELVKRHTDGFVSFALLRELREPGDDSDKGIVGHLDEVPELVFIE